MDPDPIAKVIRQAIGVDAETIGRLSLANAVRARMKACGISDIHTYHRQLLESGGELTQLIELVVVPETWFFRTPEAFAALAGMVHREWLPAHAAGQLRVLSVPCSTGEEPYTIAMALLDSGLPADRFQIDAIDISWRALEQARRAVYGKNSFRGGDLGFRGRYFSEVPGGFEPGAAVKERVMFRHGNLVAGEGLPGLGNYDAIFCRNVLIYFDTPTQEQVVRNLARRLTPEGLLFVGPSETFATRSAGFSPVDFPGAFACRRSPQAAVPLSQGTPPRSLTPSFVASAITPPNREPAKKAGPKAPAARKPALAEKAPRLTPAPAPAAAPPAGRELETAHRLANSGKLTEALGLTEAWLRKHPPAADAYYLLGLIRDTMDHPEEAVRHYRRALYLKPNHQETLLHFALLLDRQGDPAGARRLRTRARRGEEVNRP
ncbi:MAG: tetratricopeptide repeat protein [Verrucomicrobiales bacterium]|nr:tetratricopeptide repeat protein [Verrucomicrobiales bacterium]